MILQTHANSQPGTEPATSFDRFTHSDSLGSRYMLGVILDANPKIGGLAVQERETD